jgi:hypothetical protein
LATSSGGTEARTPKATLRQLVGAEIEGPASLFFGGWPDENGVAEYRHAPIYANLSHQLVGIIEVWRARHRSDGAAGLIREYDSAPQPEDAEGIQHISIEGDAQLEAALAPFGESATVTMWDPRAKSWARPHSYVVSVNLKGNGTARFFGHMTDAKRLESGKVLVFFEGKRFQSLEEEQAILIDANFDCVVCGGEMFITRGPSFESLFSYERSLQANATRAIDQVSQYIDPSRLELFRTAVGANRSYLRRIAGRIKVDLATAPHANIREAIDKCHLKVTMKTPNGRLQLGFEGENPKDLIRLLCDRPVEAIISRRPFIATALEEIPP